MVNHVNQLIDYGDSSHYSNKMICYIGLLLDYDAEY